MKIFTLLSIVVLTGVAHAAPQEDRLPLLAWVTSPATIARVMPIIREEAENGTIKPKGIDRLIPLLNAGYKVNTIQVIGDAVPTREGDTALIRIYLTKDNVKLEESMNYNADRNSKLFQNSK